MMNYPDNNLYTENTIKFAYILINVGNFSAFNNKKRSQVINMGRVSGRFLDSLFYREDQDEKNAPC